MSRSFNKDYFMAHAIDNIKAMTAADTVSVEAKNKDLLKFGRVILSTGATRKTVEVQPVSSQHNESFIATNGINRIVSDSTGDTAANSRSDLTVEGHTVSGGVFTFAIQSVVLTGQTPVVLSTPLARVTRVYNNDSVEIAGKISVYESAVTTIVAGSPTLGHSGVHLTVRAGKQNSEKCSTTISDSDYWVITGVYGSVLSTKGETVEFTFEVREPDGVFMESFKFTASDITESFRMIHPYRIIKPNSDVRIRALNDGTTGIVAGAGIFGVLAAIVT